MISSGVLLGICYSYEEFEHLEPISVKNSLCYLEEQACLKYTVGKEWHENCLDGNMRCSHIT